MRINVGCGPYSLPGYVNVDLYYPAERIDNAITLHTFADGSADEIMASHVLEHLGVYEAPAALARWYQVLAPGGRLTVRVPDIVQTVRRWLAMYEEDDDSVWGFRSQGLWGTQCTAGEYHKWGYDQHLLRRRLQEAGFVDILIQPDLLWDQDAGNSPSRDLALLGLYATARKAG